MKYCHAFALAFTRVGDLDGFTRVGDLDGFTRVGDLDGADRALTRFWQTARAWQH